MKFPIAWHKENLKNSIANYERELVLHEERTLRLNRWRNDNEYKSAQIARAEKMGKDGFDSEKFKA